MTEPASAYNKNNPFFASIKERVLLCKPGSKKSTYHVVLDLSGSGIDYRVGDSIAVLPENSQESVALFLRALNASKNEVVTEKHTGEPVLLSDYASRKLNLAEVPRKLIQEIAARQTDPAKKERLLSLFAEGNKEELKEYQSAHEVWDALDENSEAKFAPAEVCHLLQPLLPRFYSIASSKMAVGEEVHLTVAELLYETNGHQRQGVCTHYLCRKAPLNEPVVPVYLQSGQDFTLPENGSVPIVMIGPGTGVAPFRAFMQEREITRASGSHWLFFGEWHRQTEFFYNDYWDALAAKGLLRLDTAFSRDQEHKVYVQHKMLEQGKELFDLMEKGAVVYVCGDAHRMAKDVDLALHQIVQAHGKQDEKGAKEYMKALRSQKRYLRDVY